MLSVAKNCLRPEGAPLISYEKIRRQVNGLSRKTREIYFSRNIKIGFFAKIKRKYEIFLAEIAKISSREKISLLLFSGLQCKNKFDEGIISKFCF